MRLLSDSDKKALVATWANTTSRSPIHDLIDNAEQATLKAVAAWLRERAEGLRDAHPADAYGMQDADTYAGVVRLMEAAQDLEGELEGTQTELRSPGAGTSTDEGEPRSGQEAKEKAPTEAGA